jgi:hypothetical protein
MADSNLNTSIASLKTELLNSIPTATVDELVSIARSAKGMNLGEDAALEQAIDSRVNTLSATATNDEIAKLATVVKQFLNPAAITVTNFTSVTGDLIPDTNEAYDLGSTSNRFKDLYISGNTMFLGDTKIQDDGTELKFLDSSDNPRKMKAKEIDLDDGSGKIRLKRNAQGKLDFRTIDNSGNDTGAVSTESSGATVAAYSLMSELPLTGVAAGAQAFVSENNKLFLWTGTGWYNIALVNQTPSAISGANATYDLAIDGTPTVVTLNATDPEGFPLTWSYQVTTGALGSTATVAQADNVFTITPSTTEANAGTFALTFSASDGVNQSVASSDFSLAFAPPPAGVIFTTTGTHTWTVPDGVTSISMVGVGGGGSGAVVGHQPENSGTGGGGAALAYVNNFSVTAGDQYTIKVGAAGATVTGGASTHTSGNSGEASFVSKDGNIIFQAGGGSGGNRIAGGPAAGASGGTNVFGNSSVLGSATTGGHGGGSGEGDKGTQSMAAGGGGGAGGYSGNGGDASPNTNVGQNGTGGSGAGGKTMQAFGSAHGTAGGGVGVYGQGRNGNANSGRSGSGGAGIYPADSNNNKTYGGGAPGSFNFNSGMQGQTAGPGAVRIIWGDGRSFPSTNVDQASSTAGETTV